MFPTNLDHLVWAVPDLAGGVADFATRTGVTAAPGGSHTGLGTANALVGLGGHAYLEIIGPDPDQPDHDGPRPFGVAPDRPASLVTWAVRSTSLDGTVARARSGGHDPGEIRSMSRQAPDGDLLEWRLTPGAPGPVPFLIDWGRTKHPTARGLPAISLTGCYAEHPDPASLRRILTLLGTTLDIRRGPRARLVAVLRTRSGRVVLS